MSKTTPLASFTHEVPDYIVADSRQAGILLGAARLGPDTIAWSDRISRAMFISAPLSKEQRDAILATAQRS